MSEIKQPVIKADGLQRKLAGGATPPAASAEPKAASGNVVKKKATAATKKKVVRKKAASGTITASPVKKTVAAEAASAASSTPARAQSAPAKNPRAKAALSGEARQRMISEAAYLISLKRHAGAAGPEADWLYAETVIDMVFDIAD
jgi:hypothetical protein